MEAKETLLKTNTHHTLIQDSEYYKYIFKKTEKIACAVFFMLRENEQDDRNKNVVSELEHIAQMLTDTALESLKSVSFGAATSALKVSYALVALESKLRVAHAAGVFPIELLEVFLHEIDSVHRSLRRYTEGSGQNPLLGGEVSSQVVRIQRPARVERRSADALAGGSKDGKAMGASRRERILSILRDKGEANIKDISELITDCSEKTIQRELNGLIKDSLIQREGERRWSKYKLV